MTVFQTLSEEGSTLKGKNLLPLGGDKTILTELSLMKLYHFFP